MPNLIELLEGLDDQDNDSQIRTNELKIYNHKVNIDDEIGPPKKYRNLINALLSAGPHDEFTFLINSYGGDLFAARAIVESIKGTQAMVRAFLLGECHSAASIVALACDEIVVSDAAHMMIHTASWGTAGSTNNVKRHVDFTTKMINKMIDQIYSGFMTPDELVNVKNGMEFWFDANEIGTRLKRKNAEVKNRKLKLKAD